jgi:hypothetical protein
MLVFPHRRPSEMRPYNGSSGGPALRMKLPVITARSEWVLEVVDQKFGQVLGDNMAA